MNRRYYRIFYGSRFCGYCSVQLPRFFQKSLQDTLCEVWYDKYEIPQLSKTFAEFEFIEEYKIVFVEK